MSLVPRSVKPNLVYDANDNHHLTRIGFWVRGCDPQECLQLLLQSDALASAPVNYYLLPNQRKDLDAQGEHADLIALPTGEDQLHLLAAAYTPLVEEIRFTSEQSLWRTLGGRFDPRLSEQQWQRTLPGYYSRKRSFLNNAMLSDEADGIADAWLWLPNRGLVMLEIADRITTKDLLSRPTESASSAEWTSPTQPAALPERIAGFEVWLSNETEPPLSDLDSEFGSRAGELGKSNINLDGQGLSEKPSLNNLKRKGQAWALKFLDKMLGPKQGQDDSQNPNVTQPPTNANATGSRRNSGQSMFKGLSLGLYNQLSKAVEGQREQQLKKLLTMAKSNPDEALKFAIPLGGDSLFRGLSIPGASLLARLPNYAFGGGGSGPADFWQINSRLQSDLRKAYLDMANREVAAKRFRRAAYIYANLLNDQPAAAAVLEQGGFFREAAQIYGEKLRQKENQARCLMSAGLHEQAVEIFLQSNDYLSAAETWESAGRLEDAQREYRRAVQKLVTQKKFLDAADLLVKKLDEKEEAKQLLWSQWPGGSDVVAATHEYFKMLARDHESDLAQQRIHEAVELTSDRQLLNLAQLCQQVARSYPDQVVQAIAKDSCRVAIADKGPQMSSTELEHAMSVLHHLEPADKLLARDAARYKRQQVKSNRKKNKPKAVKRLDDTIQRRTALILPEEHCVAFNRVGDSLFVTSEDDAQLLVSRYLSPANCSILKSDVDVLVGSQREPNVRRFALNKLSAQSGLRSSEDFCFEKFDVKDVISSDRKSSARLTYWLDGFPRTKLNRVLYEDNSYPNAVAISNFVPGALRDCTAICQLGEDWAGISQEGYEWSLRTCTSTSGELRTWSLTQFTDNFSPQSFQVNTLPGPAAGDHAVLRTLDGLTVAGFENYLVVGIETSDPWVTQIQGPILDLSTSPNNTRKRIAVAHASGLDAIWPNDSGRHISIANNRPFQKVLWMQGGRLFAIADDWLYRFHIQNESVVKEASVRLLPNQVVSLIELSAGVCGVCYSCGVIDRF